jgi:hypothetical protein
MMMRLYLVTGRVRFGQLLLICALICNAAAAVAQEPTAILQVEVRSAGMPVAGAEVVIGGTTHVTDAKESVAATVAAGRLALNPRHAATFDLLREIGPARIGFEVFYTGRQALEDNPYRGRGFPHVLFGGLIDWAVGSSRVFVNVENLGDVRQTRELHLVRPSRAGWPMDG